MCRRCPTVSTLCFPCVVLKWRGLQLLLCEQHYMYPRRHPGWQEAQPPGRRLWKGGVKRFKKYMYRKVGQSQSCIGFNVFHSGDACDGHMYRCLAGDPCGLLEEGADGGGCADAATTGPFLCSGVFHPCCDVFDQLHVWGEKLEACDIRRQI